MGELSSAGEFLFLLLSFHLEAVFVFSFLVAEFGSPSLAGLRFQ
jgi:hypothetical protein